MTITDIEVEDLTAYEFEIPCEEEILTFQECDKVAKWSIVFNCKCPMILICDQVKATVEANIALHSGHLINCLCGMTIPVSKAVKSITSL